MTPPPIPLTVRPLTKPAFAPYGDVIETDGARTHLINNGTTQRFDHLAAVDVADKGGSGIISIFRGQAFQFPIPIRMLERHPLGSQAFIPLSPYPWLIVVALALADGGEDRGEGGGEDGGADCVEDVVFGIPEAFLALPHQGVNYHKGTWHHPLIALEKTSDFLVVDRSDQVGNLEEREFPNEEYIITR